MNNVINSQYASHVQQVGACSLQRRGSNSVISLPFLNGWQQIKSMDQWIPFCDTHPFGSLCIVHLENYHGYSILRWCTNRFGKGKSFQLWLPSRKLTHLNVHLGKRKIIDSKVLAVKGYVTSQEGNLNVYPKFLGRTLGCPRAQ